MGKSKKPQRRKKRSFKVFKFRGFEEEELLKMTNEEFYKICGARARRRLRVGKAPNPTKFFKKLRNAKKKTGLGEKPKMVKTHLRNLIVTPEMIGNVIGVHNGMHFCKIDIRFDMLGHKLGEFALTFKPIHHGRPGIGATKGSAPPTGK